MDAIRLLMHDLGAMAPERYERAIGRLAELGEPAIAPLCTVLSEGFGPRRGRAVEALCKIGPLAVQPLCEVLTRGLPEARLWAAWALGNIGGKEAAAALHRAVGDEDRNTRRQVIQSLSQLKDPSSRAALEQVLEDRDSSLRKLAAETLTALADRASVPALCRALGDENSTVRCQVITALGVLGDTRAVHPLTELLHSPDYQTRMKATRTLGLLRSPEAILPLRNALHDRDETVRQAALNALVAIGAPAAQSLAEELQVAPPGMRGALGEGLARIGCGSVFHLCDLLEHRDPQLRHLAALGLDWVAAEDPCPELRAALPLLRRRLQSLFIPDSAATKAAYRAAAHRIETATEQLKDLPLTASGPNPRLASLPVPADARSEKPDTLPIPAPEGTEGPEEPEGEGWGERFSRWFRGE